MTTNFVKVLTVALAFSALASLGTQTAMAKGGGGGHGMGMVAPMAEVANTSAAANTLVVRRMFVDCAALTQNHHELAAPTSGKRKSLTLAKRKPTLTDHMVERCAPQLQWVVRPPGANGEILIGGAAGTEGGAVGPDQFFGPTFSAISWPSRSGLMAITHRSGATAMYSFGMPYSGLVPTTPMVQAIIMMFTVDTDTAVQHERALCAGAAQKLQDRRKAELVWRRPAAASRQV